MRNPILGEYYGKNIEMDQGEVLKKYKLILINKKKFSLVKYILNTSTIKNRKLCTNIARIKSFSFIRLNGS